MNILIIWRGVPTYWNASTSRVFYLLKHSKKYNNKITLITFKSKSANEDELEKYGDIITVDHPSKTRTILNTFMDAISLKNIHIPLTAYSLEMKKEIEEIVKIGSFDLIYIDQRMLLYALKLNVGVPKILDIQDPMVYSYHQRYLHEKIIPMKMKLLLYYYYYRFFIVPRYKDFDAHIIVISSYRKLLEPYVSIKNSFCIPYGVDIENFKPMHLEEGPQSLVFTGTMSYPPNVHAVLFFCKKIYPLIKQQIPEVKLCVVGYKPSREILKLRSDDIVITGFVEDVKPYMDKASVVVVPIISDDGGFKIKVLEAMAMGKSIVSTSLGAKGIDVSDGENIIIADNPKEFADRVIELLNDEQLRDRIGANAKRLIEEKYSWEKMTKVLNDAFQEIAGTRR